MTSSRLVRWTISCTAALIVSACQSSPTRIYGLAASKPSVRLDAYAAPPLRVDALSVPASWDRIEMLTPSASGSFQVSDFDHWSASLAQVARQTLSADLDQRLPPGELIYPRLSKTAGALGVTVDILEFDIDASRATMQASWLIASAEGVTNAKRDVAMLTTAVMSAEPVDVAHAWSVLLGQLADHIAVDAASFPAATH